MSFSASPLPRSLDRRRLARLVAGAAAVPALGAAVPSAPAGAAAPLADRRVRLRRDPDSVVSAADVALDEHVDRARARPGGTTRSRVIETDRFSMVGVTWRSGAAHVRVRVRRTGRHRDGRGWTEWRRLPRLHDGPDLDTEEARRTPRATEPVWIGSADAIQVEITGTADRPVLALIDPGRRPEDTQAADAGFEPADRRERRAAAGRAPKPQILTREAWGADHRLLSGEPVVNKKLHQIHIHHTVNSNDYSWSEVPALIRGMYRYHTRTLGWSDLGYNFLVDRFGRIWVGRMGSARRLVRGAHTLGFNHCSMGVSVIGNFEVTKPPFKVIAAIVQLAAWRLDAHGLEPRGTVRRRSQGSDHYPPGRWVRLPVIDGHRDTNDTACPGQHLYDALPRIRRRAARRIRLYRD